jgi:hypothetical protein
MLIDFSLYNKKNNFLIIIKMQKSNECKPLIFIATDPSSIPAEKNIYAIPT